MYKFLITLVLVCGYGIFSSVYLMESQQPKEQLAIGQLSHNPQQASEARLQMRRVGFLEENVYLLGWCGVCFIVFLMYLGDVMRFISNARKWFLLLLLCGICAANTGCMRPYPPVKLENIKSNEEAFLIPLNSDGTKQESSNNEEYLKKILVYQTQLQIPQRWVQTGREWLGIPNGEWQDAAVLIKVDKSPVTREWTADPNSGTSNRNEAVWVMTSDQVEFSTGWTITARIQDKDSAVKFLHNYPNGSLEHVLDKEVRGKLQSEFGLEVTDLPMDELRKNSTPHMKKTIDKVIKFFGERGITITNLGITGGFIYKDKSIQDKMVQVFNAEQEKSIAEAENLAQIVRNKTVISRAEGEAAALLKTRKAEADGVRMIADAKNYELEKAKQDLKTYMQLKQLEIQKAMLDRWNGVFPLYYMGGDGQSPAMLLQMPDLGKEGKKRPE